MPSIKVLENNKKCITETFANPVEGGVNDGFSSVQQPQTTISAVPASNGNSKEQPANPLQQIILIIEHKIRNLEKRKNKLDSYKAVEKSGKKLTTDQKSAVLKYDECLTSLELARELCKQFQSIAAAANKEAKKEAKRSAFVRAHQENAKVREVLIIQDVLKRLLDDDVREDFRSGQNGACKISDENLTMLEKLYEEIQPKRPDNTAEPAFIATIKQAADHLSAVADGRSKPYRDTTYLHIKDLIAEIQGCGYFEKDIKTVESENGEKKEEEFETVLEGVDNNIENKIKDNTASSEFEGSNHQQEAISLETTAQSSTACDTPNPQIFTEAPAATAVPTPSFPIQPNIIRSNQIPPPAAPAVTAVPVQITTPVIVPNSGIVPPNVSNIQPTLVQPPATPIQPVPAPQIGATTVQAVEHAYFKQHYIQRQMRPIHEVIGTGNFFFLQESEIDKPDMIPTNVVFGNSVISPSNVAPVAAQPVHTQSQVLLGQTNTPSSLPANNSQLPVPSTPVACPDPPPAVLSVQSATFNNQVIQNTGTSVSNINHTLQSQGIEQRQPSNTPCTIQHSQTKPIAASEHIPGFATCNTTVMPTSILPSSHPVSTSNAQRQHNQKVQLPQSKPTSNSIHQPMSSTYSPSIQQFPSLIQGLHDSSNPAQKLPSIAGESSTEKHKSLIQASPQQKQRQDDWSRGAEFVANLNNSEDKWINNSTPAHKTTEESLHDKDQYNLSKQTQSLTISNGNSASAAQGNSNSNRMHHNGNSVPNFATNTNVQDLTCTQPQPGQTQTLQQMHQSGHRNIRSASNTQFHQNSGSNSRYSNDNGATNPAPTFFKNNERFYQQNQNNSFVANKAESGYHQRSSMFKSRPDGNGNAASRSGFGSVGVNNSSGGPNNAGTSPIDYRSNARPVNSTRNTGPPSSRTQQRNHSANSSYIGPRGGSNTRGQPSLNA